MVATNLYPFGTKLRIDGKVYTVEDRISKRYNNRIDRFMGYGQRAHDQAIEFGIQHLEVEIIN
jgi:3D (Asp-Asp-Asp) domain-containing protein